MKQSIWCGFLVAFGLTIAGIQTLGWWSRQATAAQTQVTHLPEKAAVIKTTAQPKHWRSLVMHQ